MNRFFYFFICALFILTLCTGCVDKTIDNDDTSNLNTSDLYENIDSTTEIQTTTSDNNTTTTTQNNNPTNANKQTTQTEKIPSNTTTQKSQNNQFISDKDMEKIENSSAEVYFSDNPQNKYIVAVSEKYGSKKENLVALVKVNAEFPSGIVLEFSGKKDANSELLMIYEELKYVYEINDEKNTIVKASKNGLNNDGVSFVEAKILVTLAKEYFIPELQNLKENKRYEE